MPKPFVSLHDNFISLLKHNMIWSGSIYKTERSQQKDSGSVKRRLFIPVF